MEMLFCGAVVKGEKMRVFPFCCILAQGYHLFFRESKLMSFLGFLASGWPLTHTISWLFRTANVTFLGVEELNSNSSYLTSSSYTLQMPSWTFCNAIGACHYHWLPSTISQEDLTTTYSDIADAMVFSTLVTASPETTVSAGS